MDKEDVVYTYTMEYYSTIKKNKILPFTVIWMDLEGIMLSKSEKDKYHMITRMWNLKNKINAQTKQKHTHRYEERTDGYQLKGELEGWTKKVKGIKKYKLPV